MPKGIFYNLPEKCKYSTIFSSKINPIVSQDKDKYLALASQDKFKKYLPKNINFDEKVDFLGIAGECFIANKLNLNGDGVQTEEAIRLAELFPLSFIDVEHSRSSIVGTVLTASFTEIATGKELTKDEIKNTTEPFAVTIGGIVWKVPNPDLAEIIEESSNASSEHKDTVFISWELGFSEYNLILIDKDKYNLEDGLIISDAAEIAKIEAEMKNINGVSFAANGKKIGRIPVGENLLPLGIGLVNHPAGQVKPITTSNANKESQASNNGETTIVPASKEDLLNLEKNKIINAAQILTNITGLTLEESIKSINTVLESFNFKVLSNKEICASSEHYIEKCSCGERIGGCRCDSPIKNIKVTEKGCSKCKEIKANQKNIEKSSLSISQNEKLNVNDSENKNKYMKIKNFKDLTDENLKECKAAEINDLYTETLNTEIDKIAKDWASKVQTKENEIKAANDKIADVEKKSKENEQKLNELTENYNKLIKANQEKEAVETFSARMEALKERFDLNEAEEEILASDVKILKDDAEFNKFLEKQDVLLAAKAKKGKIFDPKTKKWVNKEDVDKEGKDKEAKASLENEDKNSQKVLDDALKNSEKDKTAIANAGNSEESIADKAKKAFGIDGWTTDDRRKNRK